MDERYHRLRKALPEGVQLILSVGARPKIVSMLADIKRQQDACTHEWNPTIAGGWYDGRDVRVCGKCGQKEILGSAHQRRRKALSKMVIESEGVKREVALPAALCISKEVAYQIRDAMNQFIGSESSYGWVTVHRETVESAGPNTKPLPWRAAAPPVTVEVAREK